MRALAVMYAVSDNGVIGRDGQVPWHHPEDLRHFRTLTEGHAVLMGRRTYDEVGKPLPKRRNLVISSTLAPAPGIEVFPTLAEALAACDVRERILFQPPRAPENAASPPALRFATPAGDVVATHVPAPPGAPTVVYLHGNGEDRASAAALVRRFSRSGLGVFVPEYPSYAGLAEDTPSVRRTVSRMIASVAVLQEQLGCAPHQTVLVGYSLGAALAAQVALARPIARLCLCAPFSSFLDVAHHHAGALADVLVEETLETARVASKLTMPVLLVHGSRDRLVPSEMSDRIAALVPDAYRVVVPGAGHVRIFQAEDSLAFHVVVAFAKGGLLAAKTTRNQMRKKSEIANEVD
jgi:hypothetical protein